MLMNGYGMQGRVGFINLSTGQGLEELLKIIDDVLEKQSKLLAESNAA